MDESARPATQAEPGALDSSRLGHPSFAEALRFWLKLGFISFGGPTGQIAIMHTELVEKKRWISEARFLHALNYCMLLPGPEAQQLAVYIGWLSAGQMLDGLGLAETTPGPLIMVLQFVGFVGAWHHPGDLPPLLAATLGAALTTWVTFVPCFLWIFLGAPYIERLRGQALLSAALSAITAAVVGVVLNLGVWFAIHVIQPHGGRVDWFALCVSTAGFAAMLKWKLGIIPVVIGGAALGLVYALVTTLRLLG